MAYVSRGFIPASNVVYNDGRTELYYIPASDSSNTALYDIIKRIAGGDAFGIPSGGRITDKDDVPCGVIVGFVADPDYLNQTYRTASTARYALVITDPNVELVAQEDDNGTTLAVARLGAPIDVVPGSVDTATGTSGMQLSSATLAGSPGMFRLQRRWQGIDNAAVGGTNTKWIVTFNTHQKKATS